MPRVHVLIPDPLLALVDARAEADHVDRTATICRLLSEGLSRPATREHSWHLVRPTDVSAEIEANPTWARVGAAVADRTAVTVGEVCLSAGLSGSEGRSLVCYLLRRLGWEREG